VTSAPDNDSAEFIEQARWLLGWHNARSEAFTTRAVALLGFVGVILALLLQGSGLKGIDPSRWTWSLLVSSVLALLLSAFFALRTISPKLTAMPKVSQLRDWWVAHSAEPHPGSTAPQIAESLLNGKSINGDSAVSAALEHADACATSFTRSIRAMLVALVLLALLLFNVLFSAWRG
jgi:hypothetical protein